MRLPEPVRKVADALAELPSIGPRQAIRLAFYLIGAGKSDLTALSSSIAELAGVKICERCFFIHQNEGTLCDICSNRERKQGTIMIVEKETDLLSLENTQKYTGRYFIVGPIPKTGLLETWQTQRLQSLKKNITDELGGKADEIILAFNPTALGDLQASLLLKELVPLTKKISRLGRGLPTGGEIEFADEDTLGASLERRN